MEITSFEAFEITILPGHRTTDSTFFYASRELESDIDEKTEKILDGCDSWRGSTGLYVTNADRKLQQTFNSDFLRQLPWISDSSIYLLGPFYGAIAVPSVTRCRCCCGHRCAAACDSSDTW